MDVKTHFGLSRVPFTKLPPQNAFESADVKTLSEKLEGLLLLGGIALCFGEPGVGKTYAVEAWSEKLKNEATAVLWIDDPGCNVFSFLRRCVLALNRTPQHNVDCLWNQFYEAFMNHRESQRHLIFIIDEAQQLPLSVFEQIRRLTNLSRVGDTLLSFILIGHGQFLSPFTEPQLSALKRRLTATASIKGLTSDEIEPYVCHHLSLAGTTNNLFPPKILKRLWSVSRGTPRMINNMALHCLLAAARCGLKRVDNTVADRIIREVEVL